MHIVRTLALSFGLVGSAFAASPVASYHFNNTLTSSVPGAPALIATDPHGTSGYGTDTVFGNSQTVYNFIGTPDNAGQAGLTLNTTGLLTSNSVYTVELIFKFTERADAWRRIVDVQNRTSDNGFYVDPSNKLNVYPIGGGSPFSNNEYHDVFLTNDNGTVKFYLDGSAQASLLTSVMDIDASNLINLFLDNVVGGGQGEYSSGSIALFQLYNEALGADVIPPVPGVPEPQTYALLLVGLGVVAAATRRRQRAS